MTTTVLLTPRDGVAAMLASLRAAAGQASQLVEDPVSPPTGKGVAFGAEMRESGLPAHGERGDDEQLATHGLRRDSLPRRLYRGRVLFVVPRACRLTAVDLRVLRREAVACQAHLAFVTSNVGLRVQAAREGISTFRNPARGEKARWRKLRPDRVRARRPSAGPASVALPFGSGLYSKRSPAGFQPAPFLRSFARGPSPWWGTLGLLLALCVLLAGTVFAFTAVVPTATITLTPASEPIQVTVSLRAAQGAATDPDAGVVPARILSAQVSGKARIPTSGRSQEPAGTASGSVVFINRSAVPVNVPVGTIVSTATGNNVRFATTADAPLAPNGRATVPIEAVLPGPSGNVRPATITRAEGPQALSLLVANEAATSGGTTALVGVVTEEDKARLQALLFEELKQQAYQQLNQRLDPGSFVPAESVSYLPLSPTFAPFVGEVSDELFLDMGVQAVGLLVDSGAGSAVALTRLQEAMPPGTRLVSDTIRFIPGSVRVIDPQTVDFSITAEGTLLRGIESRTVRSAVLGMATGEASRTLTERLALAAPPQIHLGPDWLPYIVPVDLPVLPWRIRVNVDWDGAAVLAAAR